MPPVSTGDPSPPPDLARLIPPPRSASQRTAETTWSAWPLRDRPRATIAALLGVASLSGLAGLLGGDPSWGGLAALVMLASLHGFVLPTRFLADGDGLASRGTLFTRRLRWREANLLAIDARGGWLGWSSGRAWRRRGITLLADPRDASWADRLIAVVTCHAPEVEVRDRRRARTVPASGAVASGEVAR